MVLQNYRSHYEEVGRKYRTLWRMRQKCRSASVNIQEGRSRSFEITVNGNLIFSKLKCGSFPSTEAIISELINIENGETPSEVIEYESSNCNLL
ncbi:unnamed protein product [Schistosoma haematobium]|nr:unnamed protein product [Schistosoma haematobium]